MQSKMKALSCPQHFVHYKSTGKNRISRASNSKAVSPIWPKIKLVQDVIPVLVTSNIEEGAVEATLKYMGKSSTLKGE